MGVGAEHRRKLRWWRFGSSSLERRGYGVILWSAFNWMEVIVDAETSVFKYWNMKLNLLKVTFFFGYTETFLMTASWALKIRWQHFFNIRNIIHTRKYILIKRQYRRPISRSKIWWLYEIILLLRRYRKHILLRRHRTHMLLIINIICLKLNDRKIFIHRIVDILYFV